MYYRNHNLLLFISLPLENVVIMSNVAPYTIRNVTTTYFIDLLIAGIPGPAHYNVKSISLLSPDKTKYRSSFIKSGDGRVPFPKPSPIPGPLSYWVNPDPGRSPFLMKKKSAAFCSKSKSASLFDGRRYVSISIAVFRLDV